MEKNQFFYTRTVVEPAKADVPESIKKYQDSFNVSKVIRSVELEDGRFLLALDDFHVDKQTVPIFNKQGKPSGTKREEVTLSSEIYLEAEDAVRFKEKLAI